MFSWNLTPLLAQSPRYCRRQIRKTAQHLPRKDAESHVYITGKTGTGKSSFLEQWIYRQRYRTRKENDICIVFLDPHGDSVKKIRSFDLAQTYADRVIHFDPLLRKGFTPCMNPFEIHTNTLYEIELHTQQLVQAIQELLPDARLSNYMRALLKPTIATLLHLKTCGLKELQDFMSGQNNKRLLEAGKQSPFKAHRTFFTEEFESPIYRMTKGSIYTKIQSLLNSQLFSNLVT